MRRSTMKYKKEEEEEENDDAHLAYRKFCAKQKAVKRRQNNTKNAASLQ